MRYFGRVMLVLLILFLLLVSYMVFFTRPYNPAKDPEKQSCFKDIRYYNPDDTYMDILVPSDCGTKT